MINIHHIAKDSFYPSQIIATKHYQQLDLLLEENNKHKHAKQTNKNNYEQYTNQEKA
jgi:hypothetical protein